MTKKLLLLSIPALIFAKTVSYQEALTLALDNNKELKAKKLDVDIAKASLKEAKGYSLGKLEFKENVSVTNHAGYVFGMKLASREANFGDFGFGHFIDEMGGLMDRTTVKTKADLLAYQPDDLNNPGARKNFETKAVYEMPLYTGGKLDDAQEMAKLQILAKEAKYTYDKKQLGIEVLKAYNGAVTAKKFIAMTKNANVIAQRFVRTATNLYKNRLARKLDIKQSKMAVSSIATKIKEATTKYKLAIAYLQFLTDDFEITDVKDYAQFKAEMTDDLTYFQQQAIKTRDDYKWMKHNTLTMKKKIAFESSEQAPIIGLHVEYGTNDNRLSLSTNKDYYLGAVGLNYVIYDGDINSIKEQKAKIDYLKTKHYFEYMKDGINLQVKKYFLEYQTQTQTLQEKIETQKMAEDILKETEDIYRNNLKFRTNMMYLLMQLQNMLMAQADVIQSKYAQTITSANLQLAIGKSLSNQE
jgi:outer membrane protein TolC